MEVVVEALLSLAIDLKRSQKPVSIAGLNATAASLHALSPRAVPRFGCSWCVALRTLADTRPDSSSQAWRHSLETRSGRWVIPIRIRVQDSVGLLIDKQ